MSTFSLVLLGVVYPNNYDYSQSCGFGSGLWQIFTLKCPIVASYIRVFILYSSRKSKNILRKNLWQHVMDSGHLKLVFFSILLGLVFAYRIPIGDKTMLIHNSARRIRTVISPFSGDYDYNVYNLKCA